MVFHQFTAVCIQFLPEAVGGVVQEGEASKGLTGACCSQGCVGFRVLASGRVETLSPEP